MLRNYFPENSGLKIDLEFSAKTNQPCVANNCLCQRLFNLQKRHVQFKKKVALALYHRRTIFADRESYIYILLLVTTLYDVSRAVTAT